MGFIQSVLESVLLCMGFQLARDCKSSKLDQSKSAFGLQYWALCKTWAPQESLYGAPEFGMQTLQ